MQGPPVSVKEIIVKVIEQGKQGVLWLLSSLSLEGQYSTGVEPNYFQSWGRHLLQECLLLGMIDLSFLLFLVG